MPTNKTSKRKKLKLTLVINKSTGKVLGAIKPNK
jgi:hypothetical protein